MSFVYTNTVPNPPNLPSTDVNAMQTNTATIDSWVQRDHFGFNNSEGGLHQQVSMANQAAPGIPANMDGVLYADANGGNSWPIWQNTLGSFQITGSAAATNPSVPGANGFTFLPGGFIFQWGIVLAAVGGIITPVLFATSNINFPNNCFIVNTTLIHSVGPIPAVPTVVGSLTVSGVSNTGFSYLKLSTQNSSYLAFYWTAIGN